MESGREIRTFVGSELGIMMIAVSPNGKQILTAGQDGMMRLWDLATGEEIFGVRAHVDGVYAIAFSADGKQALTASMSNGFDDSGIALWDLEAGALIRRFPNTGHSTTVAFSPDGQYVFSGNGLAEQAILRQYDLSTGKEIRSFDKGLCCTGFALSSDGQLIYTATNSGGPVTEMDLTTGELLREFGLHPGGRVRVEISADSQRLLISSINFEGGILSLWDLNTGLEIRRFVGDGICCTDIDMSPDGTMAVAPAGYGTAILWDLSMPTTVEAVSAWLKANRYIRPLTCEERTQYRIEPLCEE